MKSIKNWKKIPEGELRVDRYHAKFSKNIKEKVSGDFQESMREDMRGPMEGMEAVPAKQ